MPILSRKKDLIWRVTLSKKTSLTYIEEKVFEVAESCRFFYLSTR